MAGLEIIAVIATVALGVLWILIPDRNWEPWIALCGTTTVVAELLRRFGPKRHADSSSVAPSAFLTAKPRDEAAEWLERNVHSARLSESLPRALQFAKRTGNGPLERWCRLELYGYDKDGGMTDADVVPEYRAVTGRWMDRFDRMLDLSHYPDMSIVNEYRFRFGVAKLEELAAKQEMQNIADDQLIGLFREHMGVEVIRFCFSPIEVRGVLDTIRNRLAEMVLDALSQREKP